MRILTDAAVTSVESETCTEGARVVLIFLHKLYLLLGERNFTAIASTDSHDKIQKLQQIQYSYYNAKHHLMVYLFDTRRQQ